VVARPEVRLDVVEAATWYDNRHPGLGTEFREAIIEVFDALAENPFLNSQKHPRPNIRWRRSRRFPYRVVYEVLETKNAVVIAAVLHSARHDRE
jgi:mRNA-degrading endonuclease RelE of RelBE toxin-antitoxin system